MLRSFIFLFLILFLIWIPVTAEEEPLDICIEIEGFYEQNISGATVRNILAAGGLLPVNVTISSVSKDVNLTNIYLKTCFEYTGSNLRNQFLFSYNGSLSKNITVCDTFSLAKELKNEERSSFTFRIAFLETGGYLMHWGVAEGKEEIEMRHKRVLSLITLMEYENLMKQAQVLDAQKKSAEASEKTAEDTGRMAFATAVLAFFTSLMAAFSFITSRQIRKGREVDLLRRRLGNLYSMLKFNKDILNQKPPLDNIHPKYQLWMDFYTKFKKNLYLASDELINIAEKFLEYIDLNKVPEEKEKKFYEIRRNLIEQIDSDYDKYLKKLLKLTKKPKK